MDCNWEISILGLHFGEDVKLHTVEGLREIEERSKSAILTAKAGGGMVKVSANGMGEIIDITIDDSLLEDRESLQILLISV